MIRGICKVRLSIGRYVVTYDPDVLLRYIRSLPRSKEVMLEMLTKKLCTLLCLFSEQRSQPLQALKTTEIKLCQCYLSSLYRQNS